MTDFINVSYCMRCLMEQGKPSGKRQESLGKLQTGLKSRDGRPWIWMRGLLISSSVYDDF